MNCVRSSSSPLQHPKDKNQLKVENPADFKNTEGHDRFAFEKIKNDVNSDENKIVNGLNDGKEAPIPSLPTKGILKRAKLANTNNEDKKGI